MSDSQGAGCLIVAVIAGGIVWYGYSHKWFADWGWAPAPTTTEVSQNVDDLSGQVEWLESRVNKLEKCIISIHEQQNFDGDSSYCPR